ncbi:Z1 domain-containing protein [Enemella sp. A6]|uniref:Z1 domain-containing protein n=1 Tax=Enemella sp. A6 TaxID=3440152 RepID=UPI003EBE82E9
MDEQFLIDILKGRMRRHGETLDQAVASTFKGLQGLPPDQTPIQEAAETLEQEARKNKTLQQLPTVQRAEVEDEARIHNWYIGPVEGDIYWPRLKQRLESSGADFVSSLDVESTAVVSQLANPRIRGLKKKGLVLGYVQAGKTGNYTAVMAKAADAGYRLVIVLAGLHNNLRRQTQGRLEDDLCGQGWIKLTTRDEDFGRAEADLLGGTKKPMIAVVKKNPSRLSRLRDWLLDAPVDVRERNAVLIIDDEADQATPNGAKLQAERTAINRLVAEIWGAVKTGTYVGYTATPYANVFMDPADEADVYPSDFISEIPRSDNYFGAERLFGRQALDNADDPDDGLDMIRHVTEEEEESLRVSGLTAEERKLFDPELPASLEDAIRWFLLATAIRRLRGHQKHSSMLIHTTHYVDPHFLMRDRVQQFLDDVDLADGEFERLFHAEIDRAREVATERIPSWSEVAPMLPSVIDETLVVVDNGSSDLRLSYDSEEPLTVIAIGGATLSRGLTLEGLVVSYFIRSASTYDTLMQMGRWFGYRGGYEDLPRIWMPSDLENDFQFLALIEEEIRRDMRTMQELGLTPEQFGVRVRTHPGRLEITGKMGAAVPVRVSFSGQRKQTFILFEKNADKLAKNLQATRDFIARVGVTSFARDPEVNDRWVARGVSANEVARFIEQYEFHPDQPSLTSDLVAGWLKRVAPEIPWNVVILEPSQSHKGVAGSLDLGLPDLVTRTNRAPLKSSKAGVANIKALLSASDWTADIPRDKVNMALADGKSHEQIRRQSSEGRSGLLLVVPLNPASTPRQSAKLYGTRREMAAADEVIGLGLVFPLASEEADRFDAKYYSVHPEWSDAPDDLDLPVDTEKSSEIRAEDLEDD